MERPVRIDQQTLNKYKTDKFALPMVFKRTGAAREYKIGGEWSGDTPTQRPEGTRIIFDSVEKFRAARDVYFAWTDITSLKVDNPVYPEEVIARLNTSRQTDDQLTLFVPWGVRPVGRPGRSELTVMDRIKETQDMLRQRRINAAVLLMPADLYATEVNCVNPKIAATYFEFIARAATTRGFNVKPWSEIRAENSTTYQRRKAELTEEELRNILGRAKIEEAVITATRRSGYSLRRFIEQAAFAYLRERICEAEIIDAIYKPIKVSAVSKNKDNEVDRDLPRLYIIPENNQFPWLK